MITAQTQSINGLTYKRGDERLLLFATTFHKRHNHNGPGFCLLYHKQFETIAFINTTDSIPTIQKV
jgi:hypothetical protein